MNQLTGTIKSLTPRPGYVPLIDIQLEISNSDDEEQVEFVWMLARVAISFPGSTKEPPSRGDAKDVGIAVPSYALPQFRKTTTTNFLLPFDERLLAEIEKGRQGRDVTVYMSVTFNVSVKNSKGAVVAQGSQGGTIGDPRYSGQEVVYVVPRSQWEEIIQGLGVSIIDRQRHLEEYEAKAKQTLGEVQATLQVAKEAAKHVGIVEHARVFEDEADRHKRAAYWWLAFTIIFAVLAGVVALHIFLKTEQRIADALSKSSSGQNTTTAQSPSAQNTTTDSKADGLTALEIQLAISKFIVLSILLSASIWAGKVYKSHRHNFVVNRHRSNALATFQTFATGTADPQTKNAVLLQATTCIFAPQNTGYVGQEKEADGFPQILEIVRGVGPGKSG